jgi:hypothetical protein
MRIQKGINEYINSGAEKIRRNIKCSDEISICPQHELLEGRFKTSYKSRKQQAPF